MVIKNAIATQWKKALKVAVVVLGLSLASASFAFVSVGVGVGGPVYYAPPPAYYYPPADYYYAPPPASVAWVPGHWNRGCWIPGHYIEYGAPAPVMPVMVPVAPGPSFGFTWMGGGCGGHHHGCGGGHHWRYH